jgi:hypothetical protein
MKDLPAQHYLRIYRLKLRMTEGGTTRPSAAGLGLQICLFWVMIEPLGA